MPERDSCPRNHEFLFQQQVIDVLIINDAQAWGKSLIKYTCVGQKSPQISMKESSQQS